jgi:hypothetical protein
MKLFSVVMMSLGLVSCSSFSAKDNYQPQNLSNTSYNKSMRSISSAGTERGFRVNRSSISKNGYAIAWGVKGIKTNFEDLDLKSDQEIAKFIENPDIVNYIVDIETNSILSELIGKDGAKELSIGGNSYSSHYSIRTYPVSITNLTQSEEAFVITQNFKWNDEVTNLIVVSRTGEIKVKQNFSDGEIERMLHSKISNKLSLKDKQLFDEGATTIKDVQTISLKNKVLTKFYLSTSIPKTGNSSLESEAIFKISIEKGIVRMELIDLKTSNIKL